MSHIGPGSRKFTEFPENKAAWPVLIQTGTLGMTTAETMEAIPIEEFVRIVRK